MEKTTHLPPFPEVLVGRAALLQTLDSIYKRTASGFSSAVFVSGYAGSGKSALVHEARRRIIAGNGLFVYGKYDQYRNDPYHAIKGALQQLASAVLMFCEEDYYACNQVLSEAVGPYGALLSAFAPDWKKIIEPGNEANTEDLTLREQRSILVSLITSVITVLTGPKRPLVLFLDDLQWIDEASSQLLFELLGLKRPEFFLFIGAYRREDVNRADPRWSVLFAGEEEGGESPHILEVPPLEPKEVEELLKEMFSREIEEKEGLSALITHISGGNPLRLRELLADLLQEGVLYEREGKGWAWREEALRKRYPESSGRFYLQRIDSVGTGLRAFLIAVSAIGGEFTVFNAAAAADLNVTAVRELLDAGMKEGFLISFGEEYYRFTHDIIREAFYTFIPPEDREAFHLKIARRFEGAYSRSPGEGIFELAYHYNCAADLQTSAEEVRKLITLNLSASEAAFSGTAWEKSFEYAKVAIDFLPLEYWNSDYPLALEVLNIGIEAAFLSGHYVAMEKWGEIVETYGRTDLDKSRAWKVRVQSLVARRLLSDALDAALRYSARLGKKVLIHPILKSMNWNPLRWRSLYKRALKLGGATYEGVVDPRVQAYVEILSVSLASSYLLNQSAFSQITFTIFKDSVLKGAGGSAGFAYICLGFALVIKKQYKPAIALAKIGLKISSQSLSQAENAKVLMFHGILVEHWINHLGSSVKVLEKGSVAGTISGEYEYAAFSLSVMCFYAILDAREKLSDIEQKMEDALSQVVYMKQNRNIAVIRSNKQWLRGLRGLTPNYDTLSGDGYNEAAHIKHTRETGDKSHLATYYTAKLFSAFLFNDYRKAEGYAQSAEGVIQHITGQAHYPIYFYLYGLTCLQLLRELRGEGNVFTRLRLYLRSEKYIREVRTFARVIPVNHLHRFYFMRAEKARYRGKVKKALEFFTRAAEAAEENGSLYDRGLIAEHTAYFFRDIGINAAFGEYIRRACSFYVEWEADAKVKNLDELYPELFARKPGAEIMSAEAESRPPDRGVAGVPFHDRETAIGTSLAVSQEIYIGGLLNRFMNTVMKISEAHRGFLFEKRGGSFVQRVFAEKKAAGGDIEVKQVFDLFDRYSIGVLNYAIRLEETVIYKSEETDRFAADAYIGLSQPYEIICIPLSIYRQVQACLYLEYTESVDTPTEETLDFIRSLAIQAVLSIERDHLRERERELLEKNKEQLLNTMQSEKLASLGFLVAEVAHEVDNPNQAILLNAENLRESAVDIITILDEFSEEEDFSIHGLDYSSFREEYPRIINCIRASARQIEQLVGELRNFVRPKREFEWKEIDMNEVIHSTVLISSPFIKKSTTDFSISKGEIPPVLGDFQKLQQVFLNLLRNACQAVSETGGAVSITTTFLEKEKRVEVTIEDRGAGMDLYLLEEIEKPFFSTRQKDKGLGLGLYVSSTIIKKHGGEMVFDSPPGEGTRVKVSIPPAVPEGDTGEEGP